MLMFLLRLHDSVISLSHLSNRSVFAQLIWNDCHLLRGRVHFKFLSELYIVTNLMAQCIY